MLDFIKNISPTELIILAIIVITLFGSKAFIALGKTAGQSVKEIKNIKTSITDPVEEKKSKKEVSG